jgi:hypothetical protein
MTTRKIVGAFLLMAAALASFAGINDLKTNHHNWATLFDPAVIAMQLVLFSGPGREQRCV